MTHSFRQGCTLALACLLLYAYGLSWSAAHTPQSVPNPRPLWAGHVANPDQVIDAEHAEQIERLLSRLEADRGVQVAVVALADVESPVDVIDFAQQLFEHWGIGDRSRDDIGDARAGRDGQHGGSDGKGEEGHVVRSCKGRKAGPPFCRTGPSAGPDWR